jgi:AcrR family transcriptional regulator
MEQLLDAAEAVIAEVGVEGASVQAIAQRAGASMGSLYHFFPGKDALVLALAERCMQRVTDVNRQAVSPEMLSIPLEKVFERVVVGQVELMAQLPAFDALHDAMLAMPAGRDIAQRMERVLVEQVEAFLAARYPTMPDLRRRAAARFSVTTVHAVMDAEGTMPEPERMAMLEELQVAMVRYFGAYEERYGGTSPLRPA